MLIDMSVVAVCVRIRRTKSDQVLQHGVVDCGLFCRCAVENTLCQQFIAKENMGEEVQPPEKQACQNNNNIERLNLALPPLPPLDYGGLLPAETAQMFCVRMEPARRIYEARTVLRWIVEGKFSFTKYLDEVIKKRGNESASVLENDLVKLFYEVIQRDPSLRDLLHPQLKLCSAIRYLPEDLEQRSIDDIAKSE